MDKILILGGSSYIGRHLFKTLGSEKAVATYYKHPVKDCIYFDSVSMDVADILKKIGQISYAVILLGDTDPETCVEDCEKSAKLNVDSIKHIIDRLHESNIKILFTSSEFVFDGKRGNYTEEDPVSPTLLYAKQKVEIENYLKDVCDDYIIIRLSKVFGSEKGDGTIFTKWLRDINGGKDIHCATDQIFTPVYIKDVVQSIISLIKKNAKGIFHVSSEKPYSRIELFNLVASYASKYIAVKNKIIKCSIHDFNLREERPVNVSMKPDKLIKTIGIRLHPVEEICKYIVDQYFKAD